MSYESERTGTMILALDGDCTLERAAELKTVLIQTLDGTDDVVIDLEKVAAVDLSFLQLICSAHRTALNCAKHLSLRGKPSRTFVQAMMDAGFFRDFSCHIDPTKECLFMEVTKNE